MFKNISAEKVSLNEITPCTPAGVAIVGDGKVSLQVVSTEGYYGTVYSWCPATCGGWSADGGATKIADNVVSFSAGEGFAMYNSLSVKADGTEGTGRGTTKSPATMLVSGEVDLVCKNVVPSGYSISGNSTPTKIYLSDITPTTPAGVAIAGDGKVSLQVVSTEGYYGTVYSWCPATCGGWSADGGATKIAATEVPLNPGEGFAMYNSLSVNASGVEATGRGTTKSPAVLSLPSPVK